MCSFSAGATSPPGSGTRCWCTPRSPTSTGSGRAIAWPAILHGRRRELVIAGVALSPEHVYVIGPGDFLPDHRRYGIFWMERRALAAAFDLEGGFNDVSLKLAPGAHPGAVMAALDRLLAPYGGLGAIGRELQTSHWFIDNELDELSTMARILPMIFLAVAAFLLNIVLSRTISVQRTQIAVLKAVGYPNRDIALHYLGIASLVALLGAAVGNLVGAWMGSGLTGIYTAYFRFPEDHYALRPPVALIATCVSLGAGALGALVAVRKATALPPAEAMRPEPPARFTASRTRASRARNGGRRGRPHGAAQRVPAPLALRPLRARRRHGHRAADSRCLLPRRHRRPDDDAIRSDGAA